MKDSSQTDGRRPPGKIFISGCEISGDRQASHLARHILRQNPGVQLYGCGGDQMRAAGVDVRVQTAHMGYVGLQEAARFYRPIHQAQAALRRLLREDRPDLAVLVDGEHFNRFLTAHLHREKIPFIYYFVPQVWFWGRWRAQGIAQKAQLVLPAFPAELEIFRREGARVEWLGHPLVDIVQPGRNPDRTLRENGLNPNLPVIGLMPGSRWQEIENFAPPLLAAADRLLSKSPELQFILPLAAPHLRATLEKQIARAGLTEKIRILTQDVYTCLSQCEVVLLSSGTATLETALLGVPMVVFYRVKPLTYFVARRLVTSQFIAMPNILLNQPVVPELIQGDFTVDRLVTEASRILFEPAVAAAMRRRLAQIPAQLGHSGVLDRAARAVLREAGLDSLAPETTPAPATAMTESFEFAEEPADGAPHLLPR